MMVKVLSAAGSSPRMRGTPVLVFVHADFVRIIPADAGNTSRWYILTRVVWDHPRGCGEHKLAPESRAACAGSSPRMRGTLSSGSSWVCTDRIIPADAGNTSAGGFIERNSQDHPRGCGEHMMASRNTLPFRGSSPRMRGTLPTAPGLNGKVRIIPADAGNTIKPYTVSLA